PAAPALKAVTAVTAKTANISLMLLFIERSTRRRHGQRREVMICPAMAGSINESTTSSSISRS
ncbi:MAG TPA: hypothetical protein VF616_26630, partial [Duganella sp.]|uniref:hypothetical protein n=1 Tax=Duganella sp. TaxID=1904440 RepID=UPI002ED15B72